MSNQGEDEYTSTVDLARQAPAAQATRHWCEKRAVLSGAAARVCAMLVIMPHGGHVAYI